MFFSGYPVAGVWAYSSVTCSLVQAVFTCFDFQFVVEPHLSIKWIYMKSHVLIHWRVASFFADRTITYVAWTVSGLRVRVGLLPNPHPPKFYCWALVRLSMTCYFVFSLTRLNTCLSNKHTTSHQRRYNIAATSWRCSDFVTTLCIYWVEPWEAYITWVLPCLGISFLCLPFNFLYKSLLLKSTSNDPLKAHG